MAVGRSKVQNWPNLTPPNHVLARHSDPADPIWTKSGIDILLDPRNKPAEEFFHLSQNPRWPPAVKDPNSAKFDPANHISAQHSNRAHPIMTRCGIDILLDPRNKPAVQLFISSKI